MLVIRTLLSFSLVCLGKTFTTACVQYRSVFWNIVIGESLSGERGLAKMSICRGDLVGVY